MMCHMTISETILDLFCFCSLNSRDKSLTLPGSCGTTWLYYLYSSSKPFSIFVYLPYTACPWNNIYIFLFVRKYWCILSFNSTCIIWIQTCWTLFKNWPCVTSCPREVVSKCILNIIPNTKHSNRSIWLVDGTLTDTTLLGQTRPRSKRNKRMTSYSLETQVNVLILFIVILNKKYFILSCNVNVLRANVLRKFTIILNTKALRI